MRPKELRAPLIALAVAAVMPASASASTSGGVSVPSTPVAERPTTTKPVSKRASADIRAFSLNGGRFFEHGRSIRVTFLLGGKSKVARIKLVIYQAGRRVKTVGLGDRATGVTHTYSLATAGLPSGELQIRISGRDPKGRVMRRVAGVPGSRTITFHGHRFPVVGPHSFGYEGSRFGADRDGGRRKHQGQDVTAPSGTPLVAARGGVVTVTGYQATGAGYYVVIRGAGENYDYVYMHMLAGSMTVRQGQTVATGQVIGKVGSTGASSGPHLHFEIWRGGWRSGGVPIDPLPLLQAWDAWS